jgi:hypothetical protein
MTPAQKKLRLGSKAKEASRLQKQKRDSVERHLLAPQLEPDDLLTDAVRKRVDKSIKDA